jgi:hypothetical protein
MTDAGFFMKTVGCAGAVATAPPLPVVSTDRISAACAAAS